MPYIYAYNQASASAKALAEALDIRRIKHENSRFVGSDSKTVINWGSSSLPLAVSWCNVINDSGFVVDVSNKLSFFEGMIDAGVGEYLVPFTTDQDIVADWVEEGHTVVARHTLNGHSGQGIEIITSHPIPEAPLYTLYKPKKDEYRIHCYREPDFIYDGTNNYHVFDAQRKARDRDNDNPNWQVRNHENGFVYVRNDIAVPPCVEEASLKVFEATGLDFGAVDVIYNEHNNKAYVLEVNTAPGLTGTTLDNYVEMFKENFL